VFKPAGIPTRELAAIVMALDEFEAIRLADLEGLYQAQAAERMNVSRPTFSRIIEAAHRKVAEALVYGRALRIEGGPVYAEQGEGRRCPRCERAWEGPETCPRCRGGDLTGPAADEALTVDRGQCPGKMRKCRGRRNT
jgi:uncharacterized protein